MMNAYWYIKITKDQTSGLLRQNLKELISNPLNANDSLSKLANFFYVILDRTDIK